ncbi:hypothetical protein ACIA2T_15780 [Amycolatopsis japonica]|uniref:hypothetical protein n=1 Tax=Amycolatopsis japonica TaxID=208439 RepID=UPI0037B8B56B
MSVLGRSTVWARHKVIARSCAALLIRGQVQAAEGVVTLVADKLERLDLSMTTGPSRDFR